MPHLPNNIRQFRSYIIVLVDALILATIFPHAVKLRTELERLRIAESTPAASEEIAKTNGPVIEEADEDSPKENDGRRDLILPQQPASTFIEEPEDPLLAEVRALAENDPEAAMDWLATEVSSADRLRGMLEVVAIWAARDSESALLWLESNAHGLARHETIHSGMELWSQQDPVAAANWIDGMANDASKATAASTLVSNWLVSDPREASKWVTRLPSGMIRQAASRALVDTMLTQESNGTAINWALQEAVHFDNPELFDYSIQKLTEIAPEESESRLREISADYDTTSAVETYLKTLTEQDPIQASNWLGTLNSSDPLYNPDLHSTFMREWSKSDSVAASTWLSEASSGPARDAAILGFAETMIDYEPEAVAAWTNTISDPQTRLNWLTHAVQTWSRTNPAETLRWLKETELDPALRSELARDIAAE